MRCGFCVANVAGHVAEVARLKDAATTGANDKALTPWINDRRVNAIFRSRLQRIIQAYHLLSVETFLSNYQCHLNLVKPDLFRPEKARSLQAASSYQREAAWIEQAIFSANHETGR